VVELLPSKPVPLWLTGLRPHVGGKDWRAAVASIIFLEVGDLEPSESTKAAERGLGLQRSHYWYILRAEAMFGYAVFSARATIADWQPHDGGACPFDSGGFWHGYIATDPPLLTGGAKKSFFERHNQPLAVWRQGFDAYLSSNYDRARDYIRGRAPRHGLPEIMKVSTNTTQAWTWEARTRPDAPLRERIELIGLYWSAQDQDQFEYWVESESSYDDSKQEKLVAWTQSHSRRCAPSESPAARATLDLEQDFGG